MLRIIGVLFAVFAFSGIIAISSGQAAADVVSILMIAVFAAGAFLLLKRSRAKREKRGKAKKQPKPQAKPDSAATNFSYLNFKVKGTSFETDGVSRQAELQKIKDNLPPYRSKPNVALKPYTYEGEPAIGCYVNGFQIGNVPREMIQQVQDALKQPGAVVSGFAVTGGGMRSGEKLHYGARIVIRYESKK